MRILLFILGFMVGFILSGILIIYLLNYPTNIVILQAFGSIGILISAIIAFATYIMNTINKSKDININKSKSNLDLSLEFLKHSYETLTNGNEMLIPRKDRLIWLTSSRQILTAQNISKEISEESHKKIYYEYENFWRTKFYSFLESFKSDMDIRYFADKKEHALCTQLEDRQPLAEESLAVIFRFTKWQENREDLIPKICPFTNEEIEKFKFSGYQGLADHLEEFKKYQRKD